ncbi:Pyridoxamine 5'-phosphate oxidase [compost metagenome]
MNKLEQFIGEHKEGFLATIENGEPRIRPFQIQFVVDEKFYLCTANTKEVYKQVQQHPFVEFSVSAPGNVFVRIRGKVKFDNNLILKQRIINENDLVRSIYKSGDHPSFEIFYIETGEGIIAALDGRAPEFYKINESTEEATI